MRDDNRQAAERAAKWNSRPDYRGPERAYTRIEEGTSETLVYFVCGHVGRFNPIFDYSLDPTHKCSDCGKEQIEEYKRLTGE
jgi:hypothetical protein